ncbi:MAG: protein-disulfide reductase DsbD [Gammaproteobacteria bacterium]
MRIYRHSPLAMPRSAPSALAARAMLTLALLLWLAASPATAAQPEPLPVDQAFQYAAEARDGTLYVNWTVEPGYYLYQKRFAFESLAADVSLGEPVFPAGEIHEDEFFGESVVFRGQFTVAMPYQQASGSDATLELQLKSQGCADFGLCYPPQTWIARVSLPAAQDSRGSALMDLIGRDQAIGEFLPPDEAFRLTATPVNQGWVELVWQIAPGYYLYRHALGFQALGTDESVGMAVIPDGKKKTDEFFGEVETYTDMLSVRLPVSGGGDGQIQLEVAYQGCAEDGICYPPMKKSLTLDLSGDIGNSAQSIGSGPVSEQDRLAGLIRDGALPWVMATFFGFGLLLAFTPCVLPMVPILSSVIVGSGTTIRTGRAFSLSLMFVLAMAFTYTAAGVVVAMLGQNLQAAFQHPLILLTFAGVFVALALSMFGLYELQVPAALQTRLSEISQKQQGGTLLGAGVMGFLSALIVGPCVAAPLAAALIVIGQSGDAVRGGLTLFAMSLGMGVPLLAFGVSAGKLLPKAGPWMNAIKHGFGVLLLGVAIWMLERILPPSLTLALWGALLIGTGVAMGALCKQSAVVFRIVGLLALLYGGVLIAGAAAGSHDPLRPLQGFGDAQPGQELDFRLIKSAAELDVALADASASGQLVMLDFYADWCVDCKKMERYTFTDSSVSKALNGMLLLKADVTANDELDRELLNRFGIFGPPTIAFFGPDGIEVRGFRQVGFAPADEFSRHINQFRAQAQP